MQPSLIDEALKSELAALYSAEDRHYHGLSHIEAMLALAEEYRGLLDDPEAIEAAIWFHDAIYDVRRHDNEERSAAWAASCLERAGVAQATIDKVVSLILATRHHVPGADPDACLLVDVDLGILGAPPSRFHEYERQIRAEYAHVPDEVFARKRHELLEDFMQRPVLFSTAACRARYEQQARSNLSKALAQPQ